MTVYINDFKDFFIFLRNFKVFDIELQGRLNTVIGKNLIIYQ